MAHTRALLPCANEGYETGHGIVHPVRAVVFGHTLKRKPLPAKASLGRLSGLHAHHTGLRKFICKTFGQRLHVLCVCTITMEQQEQLRGLRGGLNDDVLGHAPILPDQLSTKMRALRGVNTNVSPSLYCCSANKWAESWASITVSLAKS